MDLRIGWRTLIQQPAYTLTVVLILSIGMAASLLLLGFVRFSTSYNAQIPNVDELYVVNQYYNVADTRPKYEAAPLFLRAVAIDTPGVKDATSYLPMRPVERPLTVRAQRGLQTVSALVVLPGFDSTLGLQSRQGDLRLALAQPDSFVLSEAAAVRLFGNAEALGRTLQAEGKTVRVGAVVRVPANTTIPFEALFGVNSVLTDPSIRSEMLTGEQAWMGKLLIRVQPGASLSAIRDALQRVVDRMPSLQNYPPETKARLAGRSAFDLELAPLRDAYLDHRVEASRLAPGQRANPAVLAGLVLIAVAILALAGINYVNLATVRVLRRQREVALRKVLGASAGRVAGLFIAESILAALVATAFGLLLVWLALPAFSQMVNRELEGMITLSNIAAALALGCTLGVLTSLYPTWIALHVLPTQMLAGRPDTESLGSTRFRRVLTVVQTATAMCLTGVTIAIAWQTDYMMRAEPGFDPTPLVVVGLPEPVRHSDKARGFMTALAAQPGVEGIAVSEDPIGKLDMAWSRELTRPGGTAALMEMKGVSVNFFQQYRIQPLLGRLFDARRDKEDDLVPVVLNAIAARELGFASPQAALGETVLFTGFDGKVVRKRVIGIAPELRFHSLRSAPRATAFELWTAGVTLSVRASGDKAVVEDAVRRLWPRYFPEQVLNMQRAGVILAANYEEDARMVRLLVAASAVALLIAAFGTYTLSANTVQRRAREILLRKLHGARRADIGLVIIRETGTLTVFATALALPIALLLIRRYLSNFIEHAPIGYWTLSFALLITLAVTAFATIRHTWLAMHMSPADALRA
ncbi:FtsX-like permease family protein [Duganella sp. FT94W]|uniref:FtsX-like permease family protein n=1 Tax=Duganella lactea TaxID=2692173 RepID=A0ABW9VAT5_9BURK|nr:FtsX-like permease family protein [Duganella lactea]MYM36513.1 FtsX-like permease family protein [Duganella lactea]